LHQPWEVVLSDEINLYIFSQFVEITYEFPQFVSLEFIPEKQDFYQDNGHPT